MRPWRRRQRDPSKGALRLGGRGTAVLSGDAVRARRGTRRDAGVRGRAVGSAARGDAALAKEALRLAVGAAAHPGTLCGTGDTCTRLVRGGGGGCDERNLLPRLEVL